MKTPYFTAFGVHDSQRRRKDCGRFVGGNSRNRQIRLKEAFFKSTVQKRQKIAIDEIAVKKGRKYVTLVRYLETRRISQVVEELATCAV